MEGSKKMHSGNTVCICYQPEIDLQTGRLVGAVAMGGGETIRLLKRVCAFLAERVRQGRKVLPVSLKVSGENFESPDLLGDILDVANSFVLPVSLCLEIEEACFDDPKASVCQAAELLRSAGCQIVVSGYRAGSTSLRMLRDLAFDVLKLDGRFAAEMALEDRPEAVVAAGMVEIAQQLRITVCCDGIETQEQVLAARNLGCRRGMGGFFFPPLSESGFAEMIDKEKVCRDLPGMDQYDRKLCDYYLKLPEIMGLTLYEYDVRNDRLFFTSPPDNPMDLPLVVEGYGEKMRKGELEDVQSVFGNGMPDSHDGSQNRIWLDREQFCTLPNGDKRWIRTSFILIRDDEGRRQAYIGYLKDITEEKLHIDRLILEAQIDQMTGLYRKEIFEKLCRSELDGAGGEKIYALFFLDIDDFKLLNDTMGHQFGDQALAQTGEFLLRMFREGDMVGRVGGDEFMVLMKDVGNEDIIRKKADEICRKARDVLNVNRRFAGSCSVGIVLGRLGNSGYEQAVGDADKALYLAKGMGKNCFYITKSD